VRKVKTPLRHTFDFNVKFMLAFLNESLTRLMWPSHQNWWGYPYATLNRVHRDIVRAISAVRGRTLS